MTILGVETLAIVRATFAEVDALHSAIMLRMWHHARPLEQRDMLMADFAIGGRTCSLMQAFLQAVRQRQTGTWPSMRMPMGLSHVHLPMLEQAFMGALGDVLGPLARRMVLNAWGDMVRAFLRELGRQG